MHHLNRLYLRPLSISQPSSVDNVEYYNLGENRIDIYREFGQSIYAFGHTYIFINLIERSKNTNLTIVPNIWLVFLCVGRISAAFTFEEKIELSKELLKLWYIKWEKRSLFDLISFTGISCSWHAFVLSNLFPLKFLVYIRIQKKNSDLFPSYSF